jgi:hypothetical protein
MAITEFFAGVAVADYGAMRAWYERLMGKPPDFYPHDREAVWQVTEHGWLYVVADAERAAGKALLTVLVDDLDGHVALLAARQLPIGPVDSSLGAVRTAAIVDPEGNKITFAQP